VGQVPDGAPDDFQPTTNHSLIPVNVKLFADILENRRDPLFHSYAFGFKIALLDMSVAQLDVEPQTL